MLAGAISHAADVVGPAVTATFAPDGTLWRATPGQSSLAVDFSTDLGGTFSAPVRLTAGKGRIRAQAEDRPQIGVDAGGNVYVIFAADAAQPWTRFVSVSTDGGRSFSAPVPLSARADRVIQYEPALLVGAGARSFWIEEVPGAASGHASVGVLYTSLLGTDASRATAHPGLELHASMCECCRLAPAADVSGDTALLARLVFDARVRDHGVITIRSDGSATPARRVTDDDWSIDACPESGPALAISASGRYHLAWFTQGRRRQGLFYAWSDDKGMALSAPLSIGAPGALPAHAHLTSAGKTIVVTWQQYDGRKTSIHAMASADDGASWSPPREIGSTAGAADYPFALTHGGRFYISWYAEEPGYRLIAFTMPEATDR